MPPQVNARMLSISSDSSSEDWDVAAGAGTPKWEGDVGVYVLDNVHTNFSQNEGSLVKTRDINIIIDMPLRDSNGQPLRITTGDIVEYTWDGGTHVRRVMEANGAVMAGVPNYLRLHMEPQQVEQ